MRVWEHISSKENFTQLVVSIYVMICQTDVALLRVFICPDIKSRATAEMIVRGQPLLHYVLDTIVHLTTCVRQCKTTCVAMRVSYTI